MPQELSHPDATAGAGLSPTVTAVYERILADILSGARRAGSVVRDVDIARELGVSRTPVREALQLLRGIGVVEVLPSRFTRIALLGPEDIARAGLVSLGLYGLVVEELASGATPLPIDELESEQAAAASAIDDPQAFFSHSFRLHDRIVQLSSNEHLRRAIDGVVHALRLALLTNAETVDLGDILAGQRGIIDGLRERDPELAGRGVLALRGLGDRLPLPSAR